MKNECLFCKIANKEQDALILYEDEIVIVFMDAFPNCDGHVLIVPKVHYETIYDLEDEVFLHINKIAKEYGKILMKKLDKSAMTFLINYGDEQIIKHFHLHLLPNKQEPASLTKEEVFKKVME